MLQCSFNETYIAIYPQPDSYFHGQRRKLLNKSVPVHKSDNGNLGKSGKKVIRTAVTSWQKSIEYAKTQHVKGNGNTDCLLSFITLTLSATQIHPHKEIKRTLLNHFLIVIQRKYEINRWLWKAEVQKNGNIHFHILIDKYIEKKELQNLWNGIQNKLGYVDRFREKFNHENPPSTEIKRVKDISTTLAYLRKYLTKKGEEIENFGRCWGCSDNLRKVSSFKLEMHSELDEIFRSEVEKGNSKVIVKDSVTILTDEKGIIHAKVIEKYNNLYEYWLTINAMLLGFIPDTNLKKSKFNDRHSVTECDYVPAAHNHARKKFYQSAIIY